MKDILMQKIKLGGKSYLIPSSLLTCDLQSLISKIHRQEQFEVTFKERQALTNVYEDQNVIKLG